MKYIVVILVGVLLFACFKGIKLAVSKISSEKRYYKVILTSVSIFELIMWSAFIFWSLERLFQFKSYFTYLFLAAVFIFVLLVAYYFVNDLFAGAIFRIQHYPQKGKFYTFKKYSGKVKSIGSTGMILETSEGEEVDVPYSELRGPVFENKEVRAQSDIKIKLKIEKKGSKEEMIEKINEVILTSAYASFKKKPTIKVLAENPQDIQFEITLSTFNSIHQSIIEKRLKEELQK